MTEPEYWVPESLRSRLGVGAKVRVRGFGECPLRGQEQRGWRHDEHHTLCHKDHVVGQEGIIRSEEWPQPGHPYVVTFFGEGAEGHYAAVELEPI